MSSLRPDGYGVRVVARIGRAFLLGDDGLLRAVARVLEEAERAGVGRRVVVRRGLVSRDRLGLRRGLGLGLAVHRAVAAGADGAVTPGTDRRSGRR